MLPIITVYRIVFRDKEKIIFYRYHNKNSDNGETIEENICAKCGLQVQTKYIPQYIMDLEAIL